MTKRLRLFSDLELQDAPHGMITSPDRTQAVLEIVQAFDPRFVQKITATYRECATSDRRRRCRKKTWTSPTETCAKNCEIPLTRAQFRATLSTASTCIGLDFGYSLP